jgi:hypothetical protein
MCNIIVDTKTINLIDTKLFTKVYLVGYGKDNLDQLLEFEINNRNIEAVLPTANFDNAYYSINQYIAKLVDGDIKLLSLFKLCKQDLFNIGMIMVASSKVKFGYKILTHYDEYLLDLDIIKKENLNNIIKVKNRYKISYSKQMIMLLAINLNAIFMYIKSFFIKAINTELLLMDYSGKNILGCLESDKNSVLINNDSYGNIISYDGLKKFFSIQKQLFILSLKYKILLQTMFKQSYCTLKIVSIVNSYNPKVVLGTFDSGATADIYVLILKQYNVKFGCYSHGYNYDFRIEYTYIPFDFYFVWSQIHLEHIQKGNYIKSNCQFYITGSPIYNDIFFNNLQKQEVKLKYDILVIGEYYYDDYSIQPFNTKSTLKLANILKDYTPDYKICIRPRYKDQYYYDMYSILKDSVIYSFPENQSIANVSMVEDIQASQIILGVFTAGLNDALLLNKPVIHVNFIGISEPKYFGISNSLYYADTKEKLEKILNNLLINNVHNIHFRMNKYYFNNGKFDKDKVLQVINKYN